MLAQEFVLCLQDNNEQGVILTEISLHHFHNNKYTIISGLKRGLTDVSGICRGENSEKFVSRAFL